MGIKMTSKRTFASSVILMLAAAPGAAQDSGQPGWNWGAEAYFWGASLGGKTLTGGNIDMPIGDIIKNLKFGAMGTVAGRNGDWLLFADAIYLDVGKSGTANGAIGGIPVSIGGSVDLKGFITTFGGGYNFYKDQGTSLDVTGGVRGLWLDGTVEITSPVAVRESKIGWNWDAVVGLRGATDINDKWYLSYYGDIGAGESDLTWQVAVAANYRMEKADLTIGYRYLDFDFDNYGPFDSLNLSGPFLGLKFRF